MISDAKDPHTLFNLWLEDAKNNETDNYNAMSVATIGKNGRPNNRMLLLKGHEDNSFIFYTNYDSPKGQEILKNNFCSLCFYWKSIKKQIRIDGQVVSTTNEEADRYFATRDRMSQISTWASKQSQTMDDISEFKARIKKFEEEFKDLEQVPRPPHWSGFKVIADKFEFWQEMPYRQHNRVVYTKADKGWSTARLYP